MIQLNNHVGEKGKKKKRKKKKTLASFTKIE